jgi:hypothetical protein
MLRKENLWDLFMVLLATVNLYLIIFDFAYLWARPILYEHVPFLVRLYDPVKGITPHPITEGILETADEAEAALDAGDDEALAAALERLQELSAWIVRQDPFAQSGQPQNLVIIQMTMAREVLGADVVIPDVIAFNERIRIARQFWDVRGEELRDRFELFDEQLRPLLAVNFSREYGRDGRPQDHFWLVDLPFLLIFVVEFLVRWGLAIRRRTYPRWFLFPIFHWYDVLGMIPTKHLRIFRLFRIAAIYVRLRRSALSSIGSDVFTRLGEYLYGIVAEEVSDMVALRILAEFQEEIRDGTHMRIINKTIAPRREQIESLLARQVQATLARDEIHHRMRAVARASVEEAAHRSRSLANLPLSDAVLRPIVLAVGRTIVDDLSEALHDSIKSDEGSRAVQGVVRRIADDLAQEPLRTEVETLARTIALEILEEMKGAVRVKKWTQR